MATTKDRILEASAMLFRRHGYAGTGLKQILASAGAPFGSLYHAFPGGKEALGAEVIRASGPFYLHLLDAVFDASPDVATGVKRFFKGAADTLRATDYADACPVAVIALEVASTNETLRLATAEVFESWITAIERRFAAAGLEPDLARRLAISTLAALEGAFVLSRALRDARIVEVAGAQAAAAVRAAMADSLGR